MPRLAAAIHRLRSDGPARRSERSSRRGYGGAACPGARVLLEAARGPVRLLAADATRPYFAGYESAVAALCAALGGS